MKKILTFLFFITTCFSLFSNPTDTLLVIDGRNISVDEFMRVYNKNRDITPKEEKKYVTDYLDLFINYKLKVIEAENIGYDTIPSFIKELSGYQDQLAKPYLENKELKEQLILQAYQRSLEEVNASHILIEVSSNASPADTLKAYNEILSIRKKILSGVNFEKVAAETSNDPSAKTNSGLLGWFSAFQMVYEFENAAYNTPVGQISMPFRTRFGYHILKVNDKRVSKGEVNVAHIMTEIPRNGSEFEGLAAKDKIDKAYNALQNGMTWKEAVEEYSEHGSTKSREGSLGWLGSGNAPPEFMDASFALDSGKYSAPLKTIYGYHIILCNGKKAPDSFEVAKESIESKVSKDQGRKALIQQSLENSIKQKHGYVLSVKNLEAFYPVVDSSIYTKEWSSTKAGGLNDTLFLIGNNKYNQQDFAKYLEKNAQTNKSKPLQVIVNEAFDTYLENSLVEYEKEFLSLEYPDYKNLLQEYHDGILLFNLTNDEVWKKASEDTLGLAKFYNELPVKYQWEERMYLSKYIYADSALTASLIKVARKQSKLAEVKVEPVLAKLCPSDSIPCVSLKNNKYEKNDKSILDKFEWKAGYYKVVKDGKNQNLYYVNAILPPQTKVLTDAKGLYIADYQTYLEEKWIASLRSKYVITINEDVLNQLIQDNTK